ncbi:MAG TPA: glycine--tRNA ligase [Candidatus Paceibacterota bacterium]|nr:glycine--tRNA ligase [Candidatus Paceibacterota bacterium]
MKNQDENLLADIVSLAKRRGFIFPGSEIYGGLAGAFDYGPIGTILKQNIKNSWWQKFVATRQDLYGLDTAILMNEKVWQASGHVLGFNDPLVECKKCHHRFRADQVAGKKCPDCGGELSAPKQFNMMFQTAVGPVAETGNTTYLRPETAQGMFVNFKNILDTMHPKLPFGLAQIGKAFRNEITPKDFLFRSREFEQMEIEYFIKETDWPKQFDYWKDEMLEWMEEIGLDMTKVFEEEVPPEKLAHYSKKTLDFVFDFPFGREELYGLAYRGDFDLKNHAKASGENLEYLDSETNERFYPHTIEPTFGVDRTFLALLASAYSVDDLGGEKRIFLKFKPALAPVKAAVFPLLRNKPELVKKAEAVFHDLKVFNPYMVFDDNGNIGKRYRRQDEIGTPFCVTIDFDTLKDDTVTVRHRDSGQQERIAIKKLAGFLQEKL